MSCDDPDCPGCRAEKLVRELQAEGFGVDDVMGLMVSTISDVYPVDVILERMPHDPERKLH